MGAEKAKQGPSSFTKLMQNLTSDVRAGLDWMKENGADAGEEHAPAAKKFDVNLLKRNSMVDLDRPSVRKESFEIIILLKQQTSSFVEIFCSIFLLEVS